jgi:hypothetical protein
MRRHLLILFALGCGTNPADPPGDPPSGIVRVLETNAEWGAGSTVNARFLAAPTSWHRETLAEGACRLLEFTPAQCDSWCDGACVDTNVCEPWPETRSAGTLTFGGLAQSLSMSPDELGWYYATTPLPVELFADDAMVTVEASGGTVAGFELAARASPPLVPQITASEITLVDGEDAVVTWTSAGLSDARVRLTLNANNAGHGMPYAAIIECEVADTDGEITIPSALIDRFPATQHWEICAGTDCPPSTLARVRRATTEDGGVVLEVGSLVSFGVIHDPT